eukprot:837562_1
MSPLLGDKSQHTFDDNNSPLALTDAKHNLTDFEMFQKFQSIYATYAAKVAEQEEQQKRNLMVGSLVDIFSTSRNEWLPGAVTEIKGDAICIFYHKKIKWVHKNSKNYRVHKGSTPILHSLNNTAIFVPSKSSSIGTPSITGTPSNSKRFSLSLSHTHSVGCSPYNSPLLNRTNNLTPTLKPRRPSLKPRRPSLKPSSSAPATFDEVECSLQNDNAMTPSVSPSMSPMHTSDLSMSLPPLDLNNDATNINMYGHGERRKSASFQHKQKILSQNAYEYDVAFNTAKLRLSLCPIKDGMNCMVNKCTSDFTKKSVNCGSIIVAINAQNVYGLPFSKIAKIIKAKKTKLPLHLTFRSKIAGNNYKQINNVNERGLLQIKVLNGVELKHAARYVSIKVGAGYLKTKELKKSNHHPEWNEVVCFRNF